MGLGLCIFDEKKPQLGVLTGFAAGVMRRLHLSPLLPAMEQAESMGKWSFVPAAAGFWLGHFAAFDLKALFEYI